MRFRTYCTSTLPNTSELEFGIWELNQSKGDVLFFVCEPLCFCTRKVATKIAQISGCVVATGLTLTGAERFHSKVHHLNQPCSGPQKNFSSCRQQGLQAKTIKTIASFSISVNVKTSFTVSSTIQQTESVLSGNGAFDLHMSSILLRDMVHHALTRSH